MGYNLPRRIEIPLHELIAHHSQLWLGLRQYLERFHAEVESERGLFQAKDYVVTITIEPREKP